MTKDDVLFGYRQQLFAEAARTSVSTACRTFGVHTLTPSAVARCAFAGARLSEQDHILTGGVEVDLYPRCSITCFLTERWKVKSNSLSVSRARNRAALILFSPPWLSLAETPLESGLAGTSHSSRTPLVLDRPARVAPWAAAGAFSAQKRCASSRAGPLLMRSERRDGQGHCSTSMWCCWRRRW